MINAKNAYRIYKMAIEKICQMDYLENEIRISAEKGFCSLPTAMNLSKTHIFLLKEAGYTVSEDERTTSDGKKMFLISWGKNDNT